MKLKGIDGGPHKRWSMWFNSTQREEPYQDLTSSDAYRNICSLRGRETGGAWLSSARVVRCLVKSSNERNPCSQLPSLSWGLWEDCRCKSEEGRDDVKSSCPLRPGLHTCYNGRYKEKRNSDVEQTSKSRSQFGLKSATRLHEAGIASNRESAKSRWIRSRALYTPPVKPWELAIPEVI